MQLDPKTYHYKINQDTDPRLYGFRAQDVEKFFPDIVFTSEAGYKALSYSNFSVLSIKAIQEQQAEIIELREKNKWQEEQINSLLLRRQTLETRIK